MKLASKLARVSAYSHGEDHLRVKTIHGGIVTILGALLAISLFIAEARRCLKQHVAQEMEVDTSMRPTMELMFDVTFPALPCNAIRMDTGDIGGKYETEGMMKAAHDGVIHKYRLDGRGRQLGDAEYITPGSHDNPFVFTLDAEDLEEVQEAVTQHEGCRLSGWLELKRVAGNVHFAVRPEAALAVMESQEAVDSLLHKHVELHRDPDHPEARILNCSHVINEFRFGNAFPGQIQPLEGVARVDRKATGVDKYFVKVVPTVFRGGGWGRATSTFQYSVTEYYHRVGENDRMLPGVYFLYDMSPIQVTLKVSRLGLLHLLVRGCAVCGGVWAVTGMVDRGVHRIVTGAKRLAKRGGAP